jgi:pilus assembly protein CpaC
MNKTGSLTILVLLIGSFCPVAFAQVELPETSIPAAGLFENPTVPVEAAPLSSGISPFSDPAMVLDMPRMETTDPRELNLQPEYLDAPKRAKLSAKSDDAPQYGQLSGTGAEFQVPLGQGRILTLKEDLTIGEDEPLIAVGNPGILDVSVITPKQLRLTGMRVGVTDLSVTTAKGETTHYEVQVMADLTLLQKKVRVTFPDASVHLTQIQSSIVVEGQARSQLQVTQIIAMISSYLDAVTAIQRMTVRASGSGGGAMSALDAAATTGAAGTATNAPDATNPNAPANPAAPGESGQQVAPNDLGGMGSGSDALLSNNRPTQTQGTLPNAAIVNLLRVPTSQQVMLKVRIAELNRTGMRNIGANFLALDEANRAILGTQIAGSVTASGNVIGKTFLGEANMPISPLGNRGGTTVFGIFQNANFEMPLNALRRNGLLKILAEPNLVAMSGQPSNFLVGGEYPVPVPQVGASGVAPTITVRFKEFGVRLGFIPYVLDDESLRLTVAPEVSEIDFSIAVSLVAGGSPVPGLNVRRSMTTVEMKHGQTLAIAGLLYLKLDGTSDRIPGLGDLPYLGPFFSNTSNERIEKELVILITPYIIEPMNDDQVTALPGSDVGEPTDWELYFMSRIEGRKGIDFRSTTSWDNAQEHLYLMNMQKKALKGEVGFSE